MKTPTGKGMVSDNQSIFLNALRDNDFKTLISNDYDEILMALVEYFKDVWVQCRLCMRCFKSKDTLAGHVTGFHKVDMEVYKTV